MLPRGPTVSVLRYEENEIGDLTFFKREAARWVEEGAQVVGFSSVLVPGNTPKIIHTVIISYTADEGWSP